MFFFVPVLPLQTFSIVRLRFFNCFFVFFSYFYSNEQVLRTTLVHEFHIYNSYNEWNLFCIVCGNSLKIIKNKNHHIYTLLEEFISTTIVKTSGKSTLKVPIKFPAYTHHIFISNNYINHSLEVLKEKP